MSISENISQMLQWFKAANQLSLAELSEELGIPVSSLQGYLKGTSNLRADTIELLAEKMKISVTEMVSGPTPGREQAETILRAAEEFGALPEEKREHGIQLFLQLTTLFTNDS